MVITGNALKTISKLLNYYLWYFARCCVNSMNVQYPKLFNKPTQNNLLEYY